MSDHSDEEQQGSAGTLVAESPPKLQKPPMYRVVLLNDDYTPMEFVVDVLERFFNMDRELAVPRRCCRATAGGSPEMNSTLGVCPWAMSLRA